MNNLPILHFTLGALVGLPIGYWLGWVVDPRQIVWRVVKIFSDVELLQREVGEFAMLVAVQGQKA